MSIFGTTAPPVWSLAPAVSFLSATEPVWRCSRGSGVFLLMTCRTGARQEAEGRQRCPRLACGRPIGDCFAIQYMTQSIRRSEAGNSREGMERIAELAGRAGHHINYLPGLNQEWGSGLCSPLLNETWPLYRWTESTGPGPIAVGSWRRGLAGCFVTGRCE